MLLELTMLALLVQSPQPPVVCVQFHSLQEIHWTAGVFTVGELPANPEDPSMHFLWPERKLYVYRDGQWTWVEESDFSWSRKSCSEPPWYVPVSQRLREARWAAKVAAERKERP